MEKPCLSEQPCCAKRRKLDESEDLELECDKLTVQVTELARKNRCFIEKIECLETDLKLEKQLYVERSQALDSEVRDFETLLAEVSDKLFHEKSENDKLREEIKKETEQRKAMQQKIGCLEAKLGKEYNRQYINELSRDTAITKTAIYIESKMESDLLKEEVQKEKDLKEAMKWRIDWLETELQSEMRQVKIYQTEANLKGFSTKIGKKL